MSRLERVAEYFSCTPESTFKSKWIGGLIIPIVLSLYALRCCIFQQAEFIGKSGILLLRSRPALFMGLSWLSVAAFLNFRYFWPTLKRLYTFADKGKIISLICWICTFVYVCWLILTDTTYVTVKPFWILWRGF